MGPGCLSVYALFSNNDADLWLRPHFTSDSSRASSTDGAGVEHRNSLYGSCEFEAVANPQESDVVPQVIDLMYVQTVMQIWIGRKDLEIGSNLWILSETF